MYVTLDFVWISITRGHCHIPNWGTRSRGTSSQGRFEGGGLATDRLYRLESILILYRICEIGVGRWVQSQIGMARGR